MRFQKQFDKDTKKVTLWQLDEEGKKHFVYEDPETRIVIRQVEPEDAYVWTTNMEGRNWKEKERQVWMENFRYVVNNLDRESGELNLIIETRTGKLLGTAEFHMVDPNSTDANLMIFAAKKFENDTQVKERILDSIERMVSNNNLFDSVYIVNAKDPKAEKIRMK